MPTGTLATPKVLACSDCSSEFMWTKTGRPSPRCEPCRSTHVANRDRAKSARYRARHPELTRAASRAWWAAKEDVTEYRWARKLKRFGLAPEAFAEMLTEQEGRCAICRTETPGGPGARFAVDHDHGTGEVRGLLCSNCNTALGLMADDADRFVAAAFYLAARKTEEVSA